jgi:pyrimidine operon attenuation protein/uracil phosphoribosyltransferase
MHVCQQVDEHVPYEKIASQMRELNNEQIIIVDDILYKNNKNPTKP